jgi:NAD(P)-dependent dehydrogenase (short-subunit alcohol dehydrogenase family)
MNNVNDMHGKVVLVTGANSGVGFAAATELAALGGAMVMVCRDARRGEDARARIAEVATGPAPELLIADLSSQAEIRALAQEVRARFARIDVLLNNAGGQFSKRELSVDGIEKTFATNYLAPFMLTNLLLDLVRAAPAGRVVTVVTEAYGKQLDFAKLRGEQSYHCFKVYRRSKLCGIVFAFELARRLEGTNTTSNAVSPGPTKTRFGDNMSGLPRLVTGVMKRLPMFGSPEKGARTLVYAAAVPELSGVSGRFFFKSREIQTKPITHDADVAARLWSVSEALCGLEPASQDAFPCAAE